MHGRMSHFLTLLALAASDALVASGGALLAQSPAEVVQATDALEWREIGPTVMGGRVSDFAVVESDPSTFYVGTASSGLWKTENAGTTFIPVFDGEATASIGDVTLAPSNSNVVWVGTGEPQNRQSSPWGAGVYRSTDAGLTWTFLGLEDTHHVARIRVHPRDPDVAYVAAVGHLWGPNPERGVYKTTDGGGTWERVLYVDERTGAIDLAMDANDPETLFAAMYQRQRRAWGFNGGGPGSGLYRTTDGGDSWTELTEGLPAGDKGRIGVDIYRRDGNLVCATVEADPLSPADAPAREDREPQNGVYCSTDRGRSWEQRSATNDRPMYYSQIRIDPNDPERIYLGGVNLFRSSDGGRTFTDDGASGVHLDHHALWIDPTDSDHLILGGDGGVSISWDRSDSWRQLENLPLAQLYEIGLDMREPYHVCGGLQDNGSWCAPSDTWSNQGIRTKDWYNVGGGDGFFAVMHPTEGRIMFAESQQGNLARVDLVTGERLRVRPVGRPAEGEEGPTLRWNWNTPVLLSAHDPSTVYVGANVLFRSRDLGHSWEQISEDLTFGIDRRELEIMGVAGAHPQMSLNDGQDSYGNLTALAESPVDPSVLYTGSDDGRVHVTRDGGATWTDVTDGVPGLPANTYVTRIVASPAEAGTAYAAFDGHRSDDFAAYVYVSTDYGARWRPIVSGLPHTPVNALAQHPRTPGLLFVGNEVGVYVSFDGGGRWSTLRKNLPTVPVDDIEIHPRDNDLVIGTHGRGIWIMEDITPLEHLTPSVLSSTVHLFPIASTVSYSAYTPQGWTPSAFVAPNPPAGARIRYYVAEDLEDLALSVLDDQETVRTLPVNGKAGLHEVVWDLRLVENDAEGEPMRPGPRVLPGTYTVRLTTGEETVEEPVAVRRDPRVELPRATLLARQETMLDAYRLSGPVDAAQEALERLSDQLDDVDELLDLDDPDHRAIAEDVEALRTAIDDLDEELGEDPSPMSLMGQVQSASAPPTDDVRWQIERSWERIPPLIERVNELVRSAMPALYRRLDQEGIRPDPGAAVPVPQRRR